MGWQDDAIVTAPVTQGGQPPAVYPLPGGIVGWCAE